MGKEVVKFINRLGDIAAETDRIPKDAIGGGGGGVCS